MVFIFLAFFVWIDRSFALVPLFGRDNFPFHLKGALSQQLVFCIRQIYPYLASIEDVIVSRANYWTTSICGGCRC